MAVRRITRPLLNRWEELIDPFPPQRLVTSNGDGRPRLRPVPQRTANWMLVFLLPDEILEAITWSIEGPPA